MLKRVRPELPEGCVSDLSFDGLRAGELSSGAQQKIAAHVSQCERCRERQRELDRAFTEIEAQLPVFELRTKAADHGTATPAATPARRPGRRGPALAALALAACALLGLLPWAAHERTREPDTRTKGGPSLSFYIKRGEEVFAWTAGSAVDAGDTLRFVVSPRGYTHVAIFSRSDDGETNLYYPQAARSAAIDAAATQVALDGAIELDDTLRDEQLFALFCRAPFTTDALEAELAASGALFAPRGCEVATLRLQKRRDP
jgi:hypothetical protein